MKTLMAVALLIGTVSVSPVLPAAQAQTGAANCLDGSCLQRRTRASRSISVVSYEGSDQVCVQWVANPLPGLFSLKLGDEETYSRGNLGNAPGQIIAKYSDEGISFYTFDRQTTGAIFHKFMGGLEMAKTYDDEGCLQDISYNRSVFEMDPGSSRIQIDRQTINRRDDGLITFRFVNELDGENQEIARYVYERTADYRFTSTVPEARVDAAPQTNTYVPGLGASVKKRRRGSASLFNVVDGERRCTVAAADDQTISKEACMDSAPGFVAQP